MCVWSLFCHDDESALVCHGDGNSLWILYFEFGQLWLAILDVVAVECGKVAFLQHREAEFELKCLACGVVACDF